MEINSEDVVRLIIENKWAIIIPLIIMIIFLFFFTRSMKKQIAKSKERLHRELMDYTQMGQTIKRTPGGNVSVSYNGVTYSRGNRHAVFDITIDKETVLAPCLVEEWFENRNYNSREADIILRDIQSYLLENNFCKKVKIVSDEDYETQEAADEYEDFEEDEE